MSTLFPRPRASDADTPTEAPFLEAPHDLVARYLELTAERREIEEKLAYIRAELEMLAANSLNDERPRGRFPSPAGGHVSARLQRTCTFDRQLVARELQRMGKLADVATVSGPSLARYLASDAVTASRLGEHIRYRNSIVLTAAQG